jgi:hypothetical protein
MTYELILPLLFRCLLFKRQTKKIIKRFKRKLLYRFPNVTVSGLYNLTIDTHLVNKHVV